MKLSQLMLSRDRPGAELEVSPDKDGGPVEDVPVGTMYDILRNRRRRLVMHYLINTPEHDAELGTLATQVAAWENGKPVSAIDSTLRKRTYNTLQQTHLPRLDETDLIEYDRDRGSIFLTVDPSQLELYLTVLPQIDRSWITGFLLSGVLLWLLLVGNWLAVHVLGVFQPGQGRMLTLIALLLVGVGIFYVYRVLM
jgi:hypothetical protein